MEDNDTQLQLKKRARRRLVGAVAFAGFAAVVLPMIMDQEPHPAPQDVEIRIPGQDEKPFAPKFAAAPQATRPAPAVEITPPPVIEKAPQSKPADSVARVVEATPAPGKAPEKASEKPVEKPADKSKTPEKPQDKAVEKLPEKVADKAADKTQKPADKPAEKAVEKPAEKAVDKAADKTKPEAKPKDAEAARVASILSGKPEPTTPAADGQYVILIGAFADQGNVKNLQGKLSELGIKVFTEPLESPQGRKIRVRAGPFASKDAAEKALDKMKRIGVSGVLAAKQ